MAKRGLIGIDGDSLEEAANRLLANHGCFEGDDRVFTEEQLTKRETEHESQDDMESTWLALGKNFDELDNTIIESCWRDVVNAANKHRIDVETLGMIEMRRVKAPYWKIGETFHVAPSTAHERTKKAQSIIMKTPEYGMWEVIAKVFGCNIDSWYRIFRQEIESRARKNTEY